MGAPGECGVRKRYGTGYVFGGGEWEWVPLQPLPVADTLISLSLSLSLSRSPRNIKNSIDDLSRNRVIHVTPTVYPSTHAKNKTRPTSLSA